MFTRKKDHEKEEEDKEKRLGCFILIIHIAFIILHFPIPPLYDVKYISAFGERTGRKFFLDIFFHHKEERPRKNSADFFASRKLRVYY